MNTRNPDLIKAPGISAGATARVAFACANMTRPTIRELAVAAQVGSTSQVHEILTYLRRVGVVDWTDYHDGTLRSTLTIVASDRKL